MTDQILFYLPADPRRRSGFTLKELGVDAAVWSSMADPMGWFYFPEGEELVIRREAIGIVVIRRKQETPHDTQA